MFKTYSKRIKNRIIIEGAVNRLTSAFAKVMAKVANLTVTEFPYIIEVNKFKTDKRICKNIFNICLQLVIETRDCLFLTMLHYMHAKVLYNIRVHY